MRNSARAGCVVAGLAAFAPLSAVAADHVTMGTNWLAEAEHGGFYQAVADGTYAKYGLDVTILPGGPQANNLILLPAGKIDFYMGDDMIQAYSALEQKVPIIAVAAVMQKDPADRHVASGRRAREIRGSEEGADLRVQGRAIVVLSLDGTGLWLLGRLGEALYVQRRPLHRRQTRGAARVPHRGTLRGRASGRLQAQRVPLGRLRVQHLRHDDRDAARFDELSIPISCNASSMPR